MAFNNYPSSTPLSAQHYLQHKVSDLSDSPYADSPSGIRGRESLVSLQSSYGFPPGDPGVLESEHTYPGGSSSTASWSAPFRRSPSGAGYSPVAPSGGSRPNSILKTFRARMHETIHEDDSIDMSLLRSAAPPGESAPCDAVPTRDAGEPVFDVTSFSGPPISFMNSDQAQEASGTMTRGLGKGETPELAIKEEELLATTPNVRRSFSRSLSMRWTPTVNPRSSLMSLGQEEANRRGEVIKVVMEERPSGVDISSIVGPFPLNTKHNQLGRYPTIPQQATKEQIFYPQPNWKPFWMRWPYLTFLIILSISLAICQEVLYQMSTREPLLRFKSAVGVDPFYYFVLRFVPTIITVTFGVLWQNTDLEVKRLEAFYQLSKERGALAAESINVDYITQFNFTRPFRALQRKHYAVALSSVTTLLAISVVPTLGAAVFKLNPDRQARTQDPDVEMTITINQAISRALTVVLFITAILGCFLLYQLNTRRTGLLADVKGIAGLASMAVVSHIMMDFKDMDVATPKDIHHKLKYRRYVLRNSSLAPDESMPVTAQESDRYKDAYLPENPHPLMMRKEGYIPFIIVILLFLAFIPVFLFTGASVLTEKAPWVITALAVCIKMTWGSIDTAIRMMEPYYILSKRHAPAKTLTLDYTAMPFVVVALRALLNRHWMVFLVSWGSFMAEGLTIFVTSLSSVEGGAFLRAIEKGAAAVGADSGLFDVGLSGQETVKSFVVSLAITVFILLYMGAVATTVFARRRHPFLPRQPNTIASVLAFVHQSKMLWDFVGTAKFTSGQMVARLEALGKTYGLGWFDGRDGQTHCGVDQEELTGDYKHGIDYSKGNKPWLTEWQLF
ncbi:hypothetical protein DL766_002116 [Monosporascus sp. MC13-8B]|uniref:ABC transmembrane type-1 domain-containing protein n=1 Tax=Monosporascus cannonballus TaxID=155416 RepID=A0ABY0H194_9PEZI|nr:hypothetical protein DL762_006884 [Monosporascus cannonballus]RYO85458.1 hypothetical protein DL763_007094 [Monosporascus cannonballus]RYP36229.1 hypothetical protein DL766_002116 [Monosporascus sp. MC13-8B]